MADCYDDDKDDEDDNDKFKLLYTEIQLFSIVVEAIMKMHVAMYIKANTITNEMVACPTSSYNTPG
jgi:hypothetical protein